MAIVFSAKITGSLGSGADSLYSKENYLTGSYCSLNTSSSSINECSRSGPSRRVLTLLGRIDCRAVQSDLRCVCGYHWRKRCCSRRGGSSALCQDLDRRGLQQHPRPLRLDHRTNIDISSTRVRSGLITAASCIDRPGDGKWHSIREAEAATIVPQAGVFKCRRVAYSRVTRVGHPLPWRGRHRLLLGRRRADHQHRLCSLH